ncbi:MAG TPA: hypothetical protein VG929_06080 [Actinomycetota bacterium]|nr:hypothetical protein [Actinomycetota bacterium]
MKKLIAVLAAGVLVLSMASVASAGKPKKVHDSFGASLLPFPKLAAWGDVLGLTAPGCAAGQEGMHWVGQEFTSPGKGTLRVYMEGFTGDHDLYVVIDDAYIRSENGQVPVGTTDVAPPEEEITVPLKKGQKITMIACNWLGEPEVEAHYEGTFK